MRSPPFFGRAVKIPSRVLGQAYREQAIGSPGEAVQDGFFAGLIQLEHYSAADGVVDVALPRSAKIRNRHTRDGSSGVGVYRSHLQRLRQCGATWPV